MTEAPDKQAEQILAVQELPERQDAVRHLTLELSHVRVDASHASRLTRFRSSRTWNESPPGCCRRPQRVNPISIDAARYVVASMTPAPRLGTSWTNSSVSRAPGSSTLSAKIRTSGKSSRPTTA